MIQNPTAFGSALAGAMSGMCGNGMGSGQASNLAASSAQVGAIALAFAEEYDTLRGNGVPTAFEAKFIHSQCAAAFLDRNPQGLSGVSLPTSWAALAAEIAAVVTEGILVWTNGATTAPV